MSDYLFQALLGVCVATAVLWALWTLGQCNASTQPPLEPESSARAKLRCSIKCVELEGE